MKSQAARHLAGLAAAAFVLGAAALMAPAFAEDPSSGEIVDALKPKVKFRAFDPAQEERESRQNDLVKRLQKEKTRQITVEERNEIATVVEENDLPAIDLEVFFNFDSAEITPGGVADSQEARRGAERREARGFGVSGGGPYRRQGVGRL